MRFIYNLEMHKQVDMLCQHRWLNSSATKFLFLPQQANHHSHFGPLPGARPSSSAPILCVPRMNPCAGNLGPTNIHIRFIILAKVYITILFPCYKYIYTYVCIFHHHPILTFLLSFIHRAFVNHWIVHRAFVNSLTCLLLLLLRDPIRDTVLTGLLMIISNHKINLSDMNFEISNLCPNNKQT